MNQQYILYKVPLNRNTHTQGYALINLQEYCDQMFELSIPLEALV